jgi:hypothetical protein
MRFSPQSWIPWSTIFFPRRIMWSHTLSRLEMMAHSVKVGLTPVVEAMCTSTASKLFSHFTMSHKCRYRGLSFKQNPHRLRHERNSHVDDQSVRCVFCEQIFQETTDLHHHMDNVHRDETFYCSTCSKTARVVIGVGFAWTRDHGIDICETWWNVKWLNDIGFLYSSSISSGPMKNTDRDW